MECMIDLETLGTENNSPVLSIGAVLFDKDKIYNTFHERLNVDEQIKKGRNIDFDTMKWWMDQSPKAREIFKEEEYCVFGILQDFNNFIMIDTSETRVWGNGSNFDIEVLESLYKDFEKGFLWTYRDIRDMRTLSSLRPDIKKNMKFEGIQHNALDDTIHQAKIVQEILKELGENK